MRRGQQSGAAPAVVIDDTGRTLVTARAAAALTGRALRTILDCREPAAPRACHVGTGALYWDADELSARLDLVPRRSPSKPGTGEKGGTRRKVSRSVT